MDTEEEFDPFPFNMSDFVTVDEVGDVGNLPLPPSPTTAMETSQEDPPTPVQKDTQMVLYLTDDAAMRSMKTPPCSECYTVMSYFQVDSVTADAVGATVDPDNRTAEGEQTPPVQVSPSDSKQTVEPPSPPAETGTAAFCQSPSMRGEEVIFFRCLFRK